LAEAPFADEGSVVARLLQRLGQKPFVGGELLEIRRCDVRAIEANILPAAVVRNAASSRSVYFCPR